MKPEKTSIISGFLVFILSTLGALYKLGTDSNEFIIYISFGLTAMNLLWIIGIQKSIYGDNSQQTHNTQVLLSNSTNILSPQSATDKENP